MGLASILGIRGARDKPEDRYRGSASWIDEEGAYPESDDSFGQVSIGAYKVVPGGADAAAGRVLSGRSSFQTARPLRLRFLTPPGRRSIPGFYAGTCPGLSAGSPAQLGE